ncbi:acyltransferase family protein [Jatrophihabitans sp. DSM 45814]
MTQLLQRPEPPADVVAPSPKRTPDAPLSRKFRPDIEGVRAFAVLSVVLYHAHLGVRGGYIGVDVFFVISGFLITRQLTRMVGVTGLKALPGFYSRRIKRLLPASAVVVVSTIVAARIWAPPTQVHAITVDGLFTTFYGLNYRLAIEGTQYLHQGDAVSPLQHFWSLGVEEQFYVVWPILIITVGFTHRRIRGPLLAVALLALTALSFHWSIVMTAGNSSWAYFSLQTRAWELATGALVAISADRLARMPARLAGLLGWVGLIVMIASAFWISDATAYPGSAAAVPVGAAALIIAAGCGARRGIERVFSEPVLQCFGRLSYSLYLWHWPMLIIAPMALGHPLTVVNRCTVVVLAIIAALLSFFIVEEPGRRIAMGTLQWLFGGVVISGAIICVGALVLMNLPSVQGHGAAVTLASGTTQSAPKFLDTVKQYVSSAMATTAAPSNLTPNPEHAAGDTPDASKNGCHLDFLVITQAACEFGDTTATRTAVLFGDSHMEQWEPAFGAAGKQEHWKIVNWTKSACPAANLTVISPSLNRDYAECNTWRTQTIARIVALKPAIIFVGESENTKGDHKFTPQEWTNATLQTLNTLRDETHAKIVFMGDTPVPRVTTSDCVSAHIDDVRPCTTDLSHDYTYPDRHKAMQPAITGAGYPYIDPQPWLCSATGCPPIIGNYLVYRDESHVSKEYVEFLEPLIAPLLSSAR